MGTVFRMLPHARMFRTRAAALIAMLGLVVASTGLVVLSSGPASAAGTVVVCHATDSDTTPFTSPVVSKSSTSYEGHLSHRDHPSQVWRKGTWWNGEWHPAGSDKPDLIDGLDGAIDQALCDQAGHVGPYTVSPGVTFTDPTCAGARAAWTGSDADKIDYAVTSGELAAGRSVTVGATPKPGYELARKAQTSFSHSFPTPDCRTAVAPASPEIHGAECVPGQPGQTTTPSFTAPADTASIHYTVAGTTITATLVDPTLVWRSDLGGWTRQSDTTATYQVTYPAAPDCAAEITLPDTLPVEPPTCTADGWFTLPTSPAHVTWTSTGTAKDGVYGPGTYTVTAHADGGYYFVVGGQHVTTRRYTVTVDRSSSAAHCLDQPVNSTPTAATCDAGGSYTLPADGGHVTWAVQGPAATGDHLYGPGSYQVTATADHGYHFADGTTTKSWTVEVPDRLTAAQCGTEVPVPSAPAPTPATCATDGALTLPAVDRVLWGVDNAAPAAGPVSLGTGAHHVVARTVTGFTFPGGATTHDYGTVTVDARTGDCPVSATAVEPTVTVSTQCGVGGSYTIPATPGVQYLLDGRPVAAGRYSGPVSGTVTATGLGSTVLTNPYFRYDLVVPPVLQCPPGATEVTPAAPTFRDPTCAHPDGARVLYPATDAVDYRRTGTVGLGGTVTVTAAPRQGFTFPAGVVTSWTHAFPRGLACATETSQPQPSHAPTVKPTQATGMPTGGPAGGPAVRGTQVAVPTAVDAGLATWKGDKASSTGTRLGESLVAAGLVLLLSGAWLGRGRRRRGDHQV